MLFNGKGALEGNIFNLYIIFPNFMPNRLFLRKLAVLNSS